jgi:hypothetical protein
LTREPAVHSLLQSLNKGGYDSVTSSVSVVLRYAPVYFRCLAKRANFSFFSILLRTFQSGFYAFFHVGGETEKNALSKETYPCEKSGSSKQVPFRKINSKAESKQHKFPFSLQILNALKNDTLVWVGFAFVVFAIATWFFTILLSLAFANEAVSLTRDFWLELGIGLFIIGIIIIGIGFLVDS